MYPLQIIIIQFLLKQKWNMFDGWNICKSGVEMITCKNYFQIQKKRNKSDTVIDGFILTGKEFMNTIVILFS